MFKLTYVWKITNFCKKCLQKKHKNYLTIFLNRALIMVCPFNFFRKKYPCFSREILGSSLGKVTLNGSFVTTDDALCRKNYLYYAETARAARLKL